MRAEEEESNITSKTKQKKSHKEEAQQKSGVKQEIDR